MEQFNIPLGKKYDLGPEDTITVVGMFGQSCGCVVMNWVQFIIQISSIDQ